MVVADLDLCDDLYMPSMCYVYLFGVNACYSCVVLPTGDLCVIIWFGCWVALFCWVLLLCGCGFGVLGCYCLLGTVGVWCLGCFG